jgi:hypothetical protein
MSPLVPYTRQGENFTFNREPNLNRPHLLYSVRREIRLHLDRLDTEYLIAERPEGVNALAIHNGRPVDAGFYDRILYTDNDERIGEPVREVSALAVYNGKLIHADIEGIDGEDPDKIPSRIIYTETGKKVAERPDIVNALAVFGGTIIDAGRYDNIYFTTPEFDEFSFTYNSKFPNGITALVLDDQDALVHAQVQERGRWPILSTIFYTGPKEPIAEREGTVLALAVYKGRLIDAGDYGQILYTEKKEPILKKEIDGWINALLPIDNEIADRLLALPEVREIE